MIKRSGPGVAMFVILLGLWQLISLNFNPTLLPGPWELMQAIVFVFREESPLPVIWTTLSRILTGLVISMLLGTSVGMAMGLKHQVERFFDSWVMVLLAFPAVAWAFLSVMCFGVCGAAPILTVVMVTFPAVALNAWEGTKAMDKDLLGMARAFHANQRLTVRKVFIPQILPYLYNSLKIAFATAWKISLISEVYGVSSGIGRQLSYWFNDFRVDMMLAWAVTFMALMASIEVLAFRKMDKFAFGWRRQITT